MNEDMSEEIAGFIESSGLERGERFFVIGLPGYVWYIDNFDCLFVSKPEWVGYKMVEDAVWMKLIACSMIRKMPIEESEE